MSTQAAGSLPWLDLAPVSAMRGSVRLPGSKSISNRTLLLAALAQGDTVLEGLLDSDDTARMLEALATLGVRIDPLGDHRVRVHGVDGRFPVDRADLFLGNAGTAFRPLTAVLAVLGGQYTLRGIPRMHERPIGDLVDALQSLGCDVRYQDKAGYPPLAIGTQTSPGARSSDPLPPVAVSVRGSVSSQFLTALLMAAPLAGREVTIAVAGELISRPYIEITLNLMARFGVQVRREDGDRFVIPAGSRYRSPGALQVEGDASAASYFLAAGAIGGGPVRVLGVGEGSIQGDVDFAQVLRALGARVSMGEGWIEAERSAWPLRAFDLDFVAIPDAAMTAAVLALFADGPCRLRNIGSWRVKETDRIAAMATELTRLGASVESGPDWLVVNPPEHWQPAAIDTYDDHRMAMCFSLASLGGVTIRINDPGCVAKTFPEYFEHFGRLVADDPVSGDPVSGDPVSGDPVAAVLPPVIAIDGPSASGKGTVAARVAAALGFHYLDSGALYRAAAVASIEAGIAPDDETALVALVNGLSLRFEADRILMDGRDVSEAIRTEAAGVRSSQVAAVPGVRSALLELQRSLRVAPGLVADGRDMGTVVFPDARLKVFLTASARVRAERRHKQLLGKGLSANLDSLFLDLQARDERDRSRAVAPLAAAPGAREVDSDPLSIEQVVERILQWYREAS
jgi:3-phosphoshikimate 1-carboxyvinyltransferase